MGLWLIKHKETVTLPLIQKFVTHLRTDPAHKKIGEVGICWGWRYAILSAHDGAEPYVDAAVALHPSFLSVPNETEKIGKPVSIEVGDSDDIMKMRDVEKIKEIFKNKPQCGIEAYDNQFHGFSVRGDLSKERDQKGRETAAERVSSVKSSQLIFRLWGSSRSTCPKSVLSFHRSWWANKTNLYQFRYKWAYYFWLKGRTIFASIWQMPGFHFITCQSFS